MAFNLGGFLGGAASKLVERIEDEEARIQKLEDEQRSIATRQRLARESERRKKQAATDEMAGLLTALGYSDSQVDGILEQGMAASKFYAEAGQQAMVKGVDPRTIVNFSTEEDGTTNTAKVTETIEGAEVAEIGALGESAGSTVGTGMGNTGSIDLNVYKKLYAEPEKIETSFSARLAVISQKLARDPNRTDAEALKTEQTKILNDLKTMKTAEREEKGTESPTFTVGSITANVNEVRRGALERYGFKVGLEGAIENLEDGNQHMADIAEINVASQLTQRNSSINDPLMNDAIKGIYNAAVSNLADYAFDVYNTESKRDNITQIATPEAFAEGIKTRQYRIGEVIQQGGNIFVYTGVNDPTTQQPFVYFGI